MLCRQVASCFLRAFLNQLVKKKIITEDERIKLNNKYANGLAALGHPSLAAFSHPGQHPAIEKSFNANPEICPDCMALMIKDTVYSYIAGLEIKKLVKTHGIRNGYFRPYRRVVKPSNFFDF